MEAEKKKSSNLASILWLIFFFPVGLYFMWKKTYWKRQVKWGITAFFGIMMLFSILIGSTTPPSSTDAKSVSKNTQSQPTATPSITQQMKNDYISFYKQYMAIANKSDNTNKKVMDDVTALSNGSSGMTTADLYLEASDAQDTQNSLKDQIATLNIPDSLNIYNTDLNNAQTQLFTLISDRSDTMKNMADFLNTNDLSKLKAIQTSTQDQQSSMEQAVVSLLTVGQKLGVDTTKIK